MRTVVKWWVLQHIYKFTRNSSNTAFCYLVFVGTTWALCSDSIGISGSSVAYRCPEIDSIRYFDIATYNSDYLFLFATFSSPIGVAACVRSGAVTVNFAITSIPVQLLEPFSLSSSQIPPFAWETATIDASLKTVNSSRNDVHVSFVQEEAAHRAWAGRYESARFQGS